MWPGTPEHAGNERLFLLADGETTVSLTGQGLGGAQSGKWPWFWGWNWSGFRVPAGLPRRLGTDGSEGPTDAAGGLSLPDSWPRPGRATPPGAVLANNDPIRS